MIPPFIFSFHTVSTFFCFLPKLQLFFQIRKCPEYYQAREAPPRFARHGSFEEDYAKHWRELHAKYKEKMAALKSEFFYEEQKLEADMLKAQYDHETERLKELLRVREMERDRIKQEWELRCRQLDNRQMQQPKMMTVEEERGRLRHQDSLYIQASQLTSLLDSEEEKLQVLVWMCLASCYYPNTMCVHSKFI